MGKKIELPIWSVIIIAIVFMAMGVIILRLSRPEPSMSLHSLSSSDYDLNGDGLVTGEDLDIYRDLFNRLNFDGSAQVDVADQSLLAYEVIVSHMVYLPVIFR